MKYFYLILTLALLISLGANAQSNYKPGYVIDLKGDTVRGYVDYQEWGNNPDAVNFKKAVNAPVITYGVNDIKAFGIDRTDAYRSCTVNITTATIDPNKIAYLRDTSVRTATVFLRILEQGSRLALYSYRDDVKVRYYLGEAPDFEPRELIYRLYNDPDYGSNAYKRQGDRGPIVTENTFQKQLSAAAYKYNELNDNLIPLIARSEYIEDNILSIVKKINHTTNSQYAKNHYSGSAFGFLAGIALNVNHTSPSTGGPYYAAGGGSYTSYGPGIMLGVNLYANAATKRLQFRVEFSGAENSYKSLYMSKVSPYVPMEASYNVNTLSISPQVIYNFYNKETFKIFVGVGAEFSHFGFSNAYYGSQNHDGSQAALAANNPFEFNTTDNSFLFKTGVQLTKHLLIYGAVQSQVLATVGGYFKLSSDYSQVGINYLF